MIKPHILFDNTKLSKKIKKFLDHTVQNISLNKCNIIVVVGGDGFMLSSLKKYNKYKKPFYGINAGSYGFLYLLYFFNEESIKPSPPTTTIILHLFNEIF
jgi:NAD+ kinase